MKKNKLNSDKIGILLVKLSLPAMLGIFVVSFYNVIDSIFVGNYIGTEAIAALTVSAPIQMIVMGLGMMIGVGAASLLSRSLGAEDYDTANKTLGNVLFLIVTLCLFLSIFALIYLEDILYIFGANEVIINYGLKYSRIILAGIIFVITTMALNNLLRAEGRAKTAMVAMIIGAVINIFLDWLFIVKLEFGVQGAAAATLISHICTTIFLFFVLLNGELSFSISSFIPDIKIIKEIIKIGIAAFVRTSAMSLMAIVMNHRLEALGGAVAIAVYGIIIRVITIISTPLIGIAQGMQPIVGYNYGGKNYEKMYLAIRLSFLSATILALFGSLFLFTFPREIIELFSTDIALLKMGEEALRVIVFAFPLIGFYMVSTTIFQAVGKAAPNFLLSIARQIIFLFPAIMILPIFFNLKGIWMAFPVSDFLGAFLAFIFYRSFIIKIKREALK